MNIDAMIVEFLAEAKLAGYAAGDNAEKIKLADGAFEIRYGKNNLLYVDRYYGGEPFIGEEILFVDSVAQWGMNFTGHVTPGNDHRMEEIYGFLQEALRNKDRTMPLRGPSIYKNHRLVYTSLIDGSINYFCAHEKIHFNNELLYIGNFHGGIINRITE